MGKCQRLRRVWPADNLMQQYCTSACPTTRLGLSQALRKCATWPSTCRWPGLCQPRCIVLASQIFMRMPSYWIETHSSPGSTCQEIPLAPFMTSLSLYLSMRTANTSACHARSGAPQLPTLSTRNLLLIKTSALLKERGQSQCSLTGNYHWYHVACSACRICMPCV